MHVRYLAQDIPKTPFRLIALHLNHNWRGREAEIEQENCERYCKEKNIEFYTETLPDGVPKTETAKRKKDMNFLKNALKNIMQTGSSLLIQNQIIRKLSYTVLQKARV